MKSMKRVLCLITSAMLLTAFASCSSGESSNSGSEPTTAKNLVGDITDQKYQDDSVYGAHMQQHFKDDDFVITTEVDYRYVTDDEAKLLAKYIAAIGSKDGSLMEQALYPEALKFVLEKNNCKSADEYVQILHDQLGTFMNKEGEKYDDYVFDYVVAEQYATDEDIDFGRYDEIVYDADPDAEITNRKRLSVDAIDDEHGSRSINYRMGGYIDVYIYTINGVPYVLS